MTGQEKISKLDIIAITIMLLMSGTIYFYILHGNIFIPLYLLFGVFFYIYKSKIKVNKTNTKFIIFWILYFITNYFIINPNHTAGIIPGVIILMITIGSYCIVSKLKYSVFKYLLLRIVALLALVSIIHFVLYEAGIIQPMHIETENGSFYLSFLHRHLDGQLSGLYWEPGAYQIILNFTLILYLRDLARSNTTHRENYMLLTIILASLLTGSTASYFVLCIIIASYIIITYRSNRLTASMLFKLLFLAIAGVITIIVMLNSSTVQDKLAQEGYENTSYDIRKNDNMALLQMIQEKPIIGWGTSTKEYSLRSKQLDNRTASNGPLAFTTYYGIIVAGIFFVTMYNNIKRFNIGLPPLIAFAIIMFMISFENFMMFPLMFTIYFKFAKE